MAIAPYKGLFSLGYIIAVAVRVSALRTPDPHQHHKSRAPSNNSNTMSESAPKKQRWFPLESNPTLMNDYIEKLGFNTDIYNFVDVFATEDWALEMIPKPVVAVIFLYPLTETQLKQESGTPTESNDSNKIWFIKQRIGNACGTIGLLHALLNTPEPVSQFKPGSWLRDFQSSCPITMDPIQKAELLEGDSKIATLHDKATSSEQNSTDRGNLDDSIITHFIAFVAGADNVLYELDGRKSGPVPHGPTSHATLLPDACQIIQQFMARDPSEQRFTMLALAPKVED